MFARSESEMKSHRFLGGLGCDEGGNGVDLGAQSVPKWITEIADFKGAWHFPSTVVELAKHMNTKRLIAESKGVYHQSTR